MAANPELYQITLPSGVTYDLKDAQARSDIADIRAAMAGGVNFIGVTSTELSDGATTTTISVNSKDHAAVKGDLVVQGNKEFLWDGAKWIEVGDITAFKALAYKDSASGSYTPAGTVSQPTFSGSEMTATGTFTPTGSVAISVGSGDANYTPAGTVSQPTFSGSEMTASASYTPAGSVAVSVGSGTANYTPAGSVSKPDITVTPTTDNVYSITDVGTLPSLSMTVANENLTITFSEGTLPTKGAAQAVMTGASAALDNAPAFTGTGVDLEAAFTGTAATINATGTPAGTVSQPTFSGTGVDLSAAFTGTQGNISATGTPAGTVSQPSFSGTAATITVS